MNTKEILNLSVAKLKRMAVLKAQIERLESRLAALASDGSSAAGRAAPRKRKMSAAARKRISQAQKARWAKAKAAKGK